MQFTAFNIFELSKTVEDQEFYIYELTKTNKVIKHKITAITEFDDCILIAIGDASTTPKLRLFFQRSSSTKKILGDSVYYTDFNYIRNHFQINTLKQELENDISIHTEKLKSSSQHLESKRKSLKRLELGLSEAVVAELDEEDKNIKEQITVFLKENLFENGERYGSDFNFTFLIDRLFIHLPFAFATKKELVEYYKETSCEDLNKLLSKTLIK